MAGFNFEIRRPLDSKQGVLFYQASWKYFKLQWPTLEVSDDETSTGPSSHFSLENCTFSPNPEHDKVIGNERCFCISVRNNASSETHLWFAKTEQLRRQWSFLLRKHSVHHNISNGFTVC
jgi:hypothetical protein